MFENYLINLYKNLNFYNIKNLENYTNVYSNKLKPLIGGAPDYYKDTFIGLFEQIKSDLDRMKSEKNFNADELAVKMRTFQVISELYEFYLRELISEHEVVKTKITEMNVIAQDPKIKNAQDTINAINNIFGELLNP